MSKATNTVKTAAPTKKEARKMISDKVEEALSDLKAALGDKKFHHRLKKAVKILSEDFTAITGGGALTENNEKPAAEPVKKKAAAKKASAPKAAPKPKAKVVKPKAKKSK